jgi:hypothetical protein
MVLTRRGARAARAKEKERAEEKEEPFRILDLPPELVEGIFGHLANDEDRDSLLLVRSVCRAFRNHSLIAFGTTFFEHVNAILHPLSLTILLEISHHPDLSRFVRKVTISGEEIGGVIDFEGHPSEEKMKDLQTSMARSGLDRMILTDVFRHLPAIAVVRIDNESYCETEMIDAARCGLRYIFQGPTRYNLESAQRGSNRAFVVVFACLRNARLAGEVILEIQAHVMTLASQSNNLFDPKSAEWNRLFADDVLYLELSGELGSRWTLDMLQSVRNLISLEIFPAEETFRLSHPDTGLFVWPHLSRLKLDHVNWYVQDIIDFLDAHRNTLSDLDFEMFNLLDGSWRQPFQIMLGMPKLRWLVLSALTETTSPPTTGISFDRFSEFEPYHSHSFHLLEGNAKIRVALDAILHDLRTTHHWQQGGYIDGYTNIVMFRLDFRLAQAVVSGRAEISEGECHLVD